MPIEKLATRDVVTADEDATLKEVANRMRSEGVGSIIIAAENKPVVIMTDRDLAFAAADGDDMDSSTVRERMSEDVKTFNAEIEGYDAREEMSGADVRRFPVVDDEGELVGIVTLDDVVATVGRELEQVAAIIERQSPDYSPA